MNFITQFIKILTQFIKLVTQFIKMVSHFIKFITQNAKIVIQYTKLVIQKEWKRQFFTLYAQKKAEIIKMISAFVKKDVCRLL